MLDSEKLEVQEIQISTLTEENNHHKKALGKGKKKKQWAYAKHG